LWNTLCSNSIFPNPRDSQFEFDFAFQILNRFHSQYLEKQFWFRCWNRVSGCIHVSASISVIDLLVVLNFNLIGIIRSLNVSLVITLILCRILLIQFTLDTHKLLRWFWFLSLSQGVCWNSSTVWCCVPFTIRRRRLLVWLHLWVFHDCICECFIQLVLDWSLVHWCIDLVMWLLVLNWKFVAIGSNLELHPEFLFAQLPIVCFSVEVLFLRLLALLLQ